LASENAASIPIFWGTGKFDPLVQIQLVTTSTTILLEQVGIPSAKPGEFGGLSYKVYDMGHATVQEELDELKAFIKSALPANHNLQ